MSWSLVYKLPWPSLDRPKIEQAIEAVLGQLPDRERQSQLTLPHRHTAVWHLEVFPDEERKWSMFGDPGTLFRQYEIEDDDSLFVTVHFHSLPDETPPMTWFEFDTSQSANRLMSGCAIHVVGLLGKHFGVTCEPN